MKIKAQKMAKVVEASKIGAEGRCRTMQCREVRSRDLRLRVPRIDVPGRTTRCRRLAMGVFKESQRSDK